MVLLFDEMTRPWRNSCAVISVPSRMTPALLASIVKLPWMSSGRPLVRVMAVGLLGGKTFGSNVMMSSGFASKSAWRMVPGPSSAALITIIVTGVGVGDGGTSVAVGVTVDVAVGARVGVSTNVGVGGGVGVGVGVVVRVGAAVGMEVTVGVGWSMVPALESIQLGESPKLVCRMESVGIGNRPDRPKLLERRTGRRSKAVSSDPLVDPQGISTSSIISAALGSFYR